MSLPSIDETHDPSRRCWVASADGHPDFPIQNLPYGIFSRGHAGARVGVAIGDSVLDLTACAGAGAMPAASVAALGRDRLNELMGLSADDRLELRRRISQLLSDRSRSAEVAAFLHPMQECSLSLPAAIGDYSDFYAGIFHASTVGRLFRPDSPLPPNYKYLPIGYHGRASSIRPSSVPVVRPSGQRKASASEPPAFGPTERLDYELELGIWIGPGNDLGCAIPIADAAHHIAGFCLLNDWSARDLQIWESQPLGPFLAKNFHTTISPWVVTAEALAPFRMAQPRRPSGDPRPLPYLWDDLDQQRGALDIELAASLTTQKMREQGLAPHVLGVGPASNLYWTVAQIVTHHGSNGCNLNPGDLLGTGTISTSDGSGRGCLLEITRGGLEPVILPNGESRCFLEDGDEVALSAVARATGYVRIGFGPCRATILSAVPLARPRTRP